MTHYLNGISIVESRKAELAQFFAWYQKFLAIILIGEDPRSQLYIKMKSDFAAEVGCEIKIIQFDEDEELRLILLKIKELNNDDDCGGIMVQLPLPATYTENTYQIINSISPEKDVDCLTTENLGKIAFWTATLLPATVAAIDTLLRHYHIDVTWKHVVIINDTNVIGKPLWMVLNRQWWQITILNKYCPAEKLKEIIWYAEIIVTGAWVANLITVDIVKPHQTIIDVWFAFVDGKMFTDVDHKHVDDAVTAITPRIGGVGPLTIFHLLDNLKILSGI